MRCLMVISLAAWYTNLLLSLTYATGQLDVSGSGAFGTSFVYFIPPCPVGFGLKKLNA